MKKTLLIAAIFGSFAVVSCKKSADNSPSTITSLNDVKVPAGFMWESSKSLNVSVATTDSRFGATTAQTISIYNGDPNAGGTLLSQGGATTAKAFAAKLYIPTTVTQLYVVKTSPDKSTITQKVTAGTSDINLTFGAIDAAYTVTSKPASGIQVLANPVSPDCSGGTAITSTTNNLSVNAGDVYSISGSNITINFSNVKGGTIKVCGSNVTLQNLNFDGAATLIITTSGSVNIPGNINFNNNSAAIQNFGTLNFSSTFSENGIVSNYGIMNIGGDLNLNSNAGAFTNSGTLNVGGNFQDGTSAVATNNGTMVVGGSFQPNSNSAFVNNCSLTVGGNYNQSSGVKNYSYIKVGGTTTINGNNELGMYNGAMLTTKDLIVDGSIVGYGSTSLVKITGSTSIRNQGSVVSNVQVWATTTAIDASSSGKIKGGASTADHSVYIATSGCNGEGNGTPAVTDTDGDGVPDNLDAYPADPNKAYIVTGASGTIAFEDQWPVKGDFDLNDIVVGYSYTLVTSATNKVVSVTGNYTLYARGGDYTNAFGIEFPVNKNYVSGLSVTKGTSAVTSPAFESGQTNATVILFTNMKDELATYNTKIGDLFSAYKTYSVTFDIALANAPTLAAFGQDEYNPFIYNSGRGHEVHVAGKTPTSLADVSLFGTSDDNTSVSAGRYYVTKSGLPFAINVPGLFAYPTERTDITNAFLHFADWAQSGGTSYTDWYSNVGTGYRNTSNIFTH